MEFTSQNYAEYWFLQALQRSDGSSLRLSGENSLFKVYTESCLREKLPPLPRQQFSKTVELLAAVHYKMVNIKARDNRGILFRGLCFKVEPDIPQFSETSSS